MIKPHGSWKSPITSDLIASSSVRLGDICIDGDDIYWVESRPDQNGRNTIKKHALDGTQIEMIPSPFSVRTRVHEYGGGAFTAHNGVIYFSHIGDNQLYMTASGNPPRQLTAEENIRFADLVVDSQRNRLLAVREHHQPGKKEPENTIAAIRFDSDEKTETLVSGADFYSNPRLSLDGKTISWLCWHHPNMPWDGTELWITEVRDDGSLGESERIAGGKFESIFQPQWSPDGILYFISDRNGWWNLYRYIDGGIEPVIEMEAEFGLPQWVFGMSTYAIASGEQIICTFTHNGVWHLISIDTKAKSLQMLETPYSYLTQIRVSQTKTVFDAASPFEPSSIVELDLQSQKTTVLRRSTKDEIDRGYISEAESITFTSVGEKVAYGFFYPPQNQDFSAPKGELPPLIVICHGGPTAASNNGLRLKTQFWTSRGFAVLDVNYRGSTGYGRAFREELNGQWGIADLQDCVYGAKYLAEKELVDEDRLIITGGSAGGFTVLAALTFYDVFKAGASYYGISDLETLATDTHKFEARYLDRLVAPYPVNKEPYRERSPIHFTDRLSTPVIFFQGAEDKVVLPNQSEKMVNTLREKGVPVSYVLFEEEGHGFRKAENIKTALESELYFYSRIFGFEVADEIKPIEIENL